MAAFELLSKSVRLSPERRIEDSVSNFHSLDGRYPFDLKTLAEVPKAPSKNRFIL